MLKNLKDFSKSFSFVELMICIAGSGYLMFFGSAIIVWRESGSIIPFLIVAFFGVLAFFVYRSCKKVWNAYRNVVNNSY